MAKISEAQVEKRLVYGVGMFGGMALKLTSPASAGVPDRLVMLPCGCSRFVELKAPGQKPRPLQVATFNTFASVGHPVAVLDTYAAVDEWLAEQRRHTELPHALNVAR